MRRLVAAALLSFFLFSFHIVKTGEGKFSFPCSTGVFGRAFGGEGFTVVRGKRCLFRVDVDGRIKWILRASPRNITLFPRERRVFIKRGDFFFVYNLLTGKEEFFFRWRNFPSNFILNSFCRSLGQYNFFVERLAVVKAGQGSLIRRKVLLYRLEGDEVRLAGELPVPFTVKSCLSVKDGILLFAYASHNKLARRGFADIYSGLYLLGPTLRIISSYRLYGHYISVTPLYLRFPYLWFAYSETHGRGLKSSGLVLFDLNSWQPLKHLRFSSAFIFGEYIPGCFLREGRPYFLLAFHSGKLEVLDSDFEKLESYLFQPVDEYLRQTPRSQSLQLAEHYFLRSGDYLFLYYSLHRSNLDPRHGSVVDILEKRFKVIKLGEGVIWERAFPPNTKAVVPIVDLKGGRMSFIMGDRIETYRMEI